jgi:DNA-binding transcriptional MerR regulator
MYDDDLARMIAEGDINPTTLRFYEGKQLVKQKYPNPWKYRLPCQEKESEESAKPLNNST